MKNEILNDFRHPKVINLEGNFKDNIQPKQHNQDQWSPYELNGGNIVAVLQDDVAVIAGDTRITRNYSILKRDSTKIHRLTNDTWILTAGMFADTINLWKILDENIKLYELTYERTPSSRIIANYLAKILYQKRTFPYYTFNTIVGFNSEGKAELWSYDAIGSYDQAQYASQGSSNQMILPFLDSQFKAYHDKIKPKHQTPDHLVEVVVDAFQSTAERDIACGDEIELIVIKAGQVMSEKRIPLRKD